jgi:hypothetical protein
MHALNLKSASFLFALALGPYGAAAQDGKSIRGGISAGTVRDILQKDGFNPRIDVDGGRDPRVYFQADGTNFDIFFYRCESGSKEDRNCESYQFFVGYIVREDFALRKINDWNADKRFARGILVQT